eukprot:scaffold87140_cov67-Phaeocystis_antarctica.AAC.1
MSPLPLPHASSGPRGPSLASSSSIAQTHSFSAHARQLHLCVAASAPAPATASTASGAERAPPPRDTMAAAVGVGVGVGGGVTAHMVTAPSLAAETRRRGAAGREGIDPAGVRRPRAQRGAARHVPQEHVAPQVGRGGVLRRVPRGGRVTRVTAARQGDHARDGRLVHAQAAALERREVRGFERRGVKCAAAQLERAQRIVPACQQSGAAAFGAAARAQGKHCAAWLSAAQRGQRRKIGAPPESHGTVATRGGEQRHRTRRAARRTAEHQCEDLFLVRIARHLRDTPLPAVARPPPDAPVHAARKELG